jgi:predicted RND superfamily exporter protein/(2Fe-2S) ferredoxin
MSSRLIALVYGRKHGMQHRMLAWPLALGLILALQGLSLYLILQLQINNAPEVYFNSDSPAVVLRDELRRDFPNDEALTVVFQGQDLYGQDFLGRLGGLTKRLSSHPLVDRVTSIVSLERISGSGDGFSVDLLVDASNLKLRSPAAVQQRVMNDRFAPGALASRDATVLALAVRPKPLTSSAERLALKIAVAAAINEFGLRVHYAGDAGPVTLDVAQLDAVMADSMVFVPLTAAIGLGLLYWVVGRVWPVIIGGVAMSVVVLVSVATVSLSGQPYTMATAILPSLLAAYAIATLLHVYASAQRSPYPGATRALCVDRAIGHTLRPSIFNCATTGAGLLSMVLVPIPPIQLFGVIGAWGTVLVFLTVFFLVPPLLVRFDRRPWPSRGSGLNKLGQLATRLTLFSMRRPKTIVLVFICLLGATYPLAQQVKVESDLLAFFKPEHAVSRHTRLIEEKLSGVTTLEISLRGEQRDSLQSVAALSAIRDFQRRLDGLPEVDRSISMVDLVEEMHWAMNGEKPAFRTLPPNDRQLRQYMLVYDGNDLYELVNRDFQHARIVLSLNVHGAVEIGRTIQTIRAQLSANPLPGIAVDIGGNGRLFADQVDLLVKGQINSFSGAFLQIFLFMVLLWRSVGAAAVCMLPNLAPLYFIFVLMGASGIHLDIATVMIAGVVLGITVDDTIHLYHGYRDRLKRGVSPILAIARSFQSSGRAVMAISVVLVAQFALMSTSDFIPTANFGLMTAAGLLAGQFAELLLLPAVLVLKDVRRKRPIEMAHVAAKQSGGAVRPAGIPRSEQEGLGDGALPTAKVGGEAAQGGPGNGTARSATSTGCHHVLVCQGEPCRRGGAAQLWRLLRAEQQKLIDDGQGHQIHLTKTGCLGPCRFSPVIQIYPAGTVYGPLELEDLKRVIESHIRCDQPVGDLLVHETEQARADKGA